MKKKIIVTASLLLCIVGVVFAFNYFAQNPPQKVNNWYEYKALSSDSGLTIPSNYLSVINGNFYVKPGAIVYNPSDSTLYQWTGHQLLPIKKAQNGLTDSLGRILLGGTLYKNTTINTGLKTLFFTVPSAASTTPQIVMGNSKGAVSHNGFDPPVLLSDSLSYIGFNSPFLEMSSVDYAGPNGALFLNYQVAADSPQFNERIFTPTVQAATFALDLNGSPTANPFTSAYDIFFYGDLSGNQGFGMKGANFAEFHNGPCCFLSAPYGTVWKIDSANNMIIGPAKDTPTLTGFGIGYAVPYGRLDIRPSPNNKSRIGVFEQDPTDTSKFNGTLTIGQLATGSLKILAKYTTTQKLAIVSPTEGQLVYDVTLHQMSYYNGTTWTNF
jgi:hypothetical protein